MAQNVSENLAFIKDPNAFALETTHRVRSNAPSFAFVGFSGSGRSTLIGQLLSNLDGFTAKEKTGLNFHGINCYNYRKFHLFGTPALLQSVKASTTVPHLEVIPIPQSMEQSFSHMNLSGTPSKFLLYDIPGFQSKNLKASVRTLFQVQNAIIVIDARIFSITDHSQLFHTLLLLVDFYGTFERIAAVIINKMDSFKSEFQQENFEKIRDSIRQTLKKKIRPWYKTQATKINNDIDNIIFVPTTAITDTNITSSSARFDWYKGPNVLDAIVQNCVVVNKTPSELIQLPLNLSFLQYYSNMDRHRAGPSLALVTQGLVRLKDTLVIEGNKFTVESLRVLGSDVNEAYAGDTIGIVLKGGRITATRDIQNKDLVYLVQCVKDFKIPCQFTVTVGSQSAAVWCTQAVCKVRTEKDGAPIEVAGNPIKMGELVLLRIQIDYSNLRPSIVPQINSTAIFLQENKVFGRGKLVLVEPSRKLFKNTKELRFQARSWDKNRTLSYYGRQNLYTKPIVDNNQYPPLIIEGKPNKFRTAVLFHLYYTYQSVGFKQGVMYVVCSLKSGKQKETVVVDPLYAQLLDSEGTSLPYLVLTSKDIVNPMKALEILIEFGADLSVRTLHNLLEPVIKTGDLTRIKYLVEIGVPIDAPDVNGQTALHTVCTNADILPGMYGILEYLLKQPNIKLNTSATKSVIQTAYQYSPIKFIELLISVGADPASVTLMPSVAAAKSLYMAMLGAMPSSMINVHYIKDVIPPHVSITPFTFKRNDLTFGPFVTFQFEDGKEIKTHKLVLFLRGFAHPDIRYNSFENDTISISKFSHQCFQMVVDYIYTSSVDSSFFDLNSAQQKPITQEVVQIASSFLPTKQVLITYAFNQLVNHNKIYEDVSQMFNNPLLSDVTITAEDVTLKCHKLILATGCHFFKTMFTSGMVESTQKEIVLEAISGSTFRSVIEFIYKGDASITSDNCLDIMMSANLYQLSELKTLTEVTIAQNLDKDNVVDLLRYADANQADYLHKVCMAYIALKYYDLPSKNLRQLTKEEEAIINRIWNAIQ